LVRIQVSVDRLAGFLVSQFLATEPKRQLISKLDRGDMRACAPLRKRTHPPPPVL